MKGFLSAAALLPAVMLVSQAAFAETIELVTYYPTSSNQGDLHIRSLTVGTAYQTQTPGDGTALISDKLGIGTASPQGSLHVVGPDNAADKVLFVPGTGGTMRVGIGTAAPVATLDVEGSMSLGVTVATASLALTDAHNVILTNAAGDITITLPAAANQTGRTYYIKKTDAGSGTVTINAAGGALIDGAANLVLYVQGDAVRVVTDGANWFMISGSEIAYLHPHMAKMARAVAQVLPSGNAQVKIFFDTKEFDTGGIASTATGRFTILRPGQYLVTAHWRNLAVSEAITMLFIFKNGNGIAPAMGSAVWDSGHNSSVEATQVLTLAAGDYLEMYVASSAGGNTDTRSDTRPQMSVVELRH